MEKAYLITEKTDFEKFSASLVDIDRIYIGDAYCEHNLFYFLDSKDFLDTVFSFGKPVTLTTPIISDKNLTKLIPYIEKFAAMQGFELVINDHGVFHYAKKNFPDITMIWGNFLAWQGKDPFLKIFKDKDTHKRVSIDNDYYAKFFSANSVSLVELYNAFQWLELDREYNLALYYPYVVYSVNRYCPTKLVNDGKGYLTVVEDCDGCAGKRSPDLRMDLKMKTEYSENHFAGNKQFYRNDELMEDSRIKRIVYNHDLLW